MRQNFLFLLLTLTLITACGDKENTKAIPSLKGSETSTSPNVLNNDQNILDENKYFSSKIKYSCESKQNCRDEIVLIAIKDKSKVTTCVGAMTNTEMIDESVIFHRTCIESIKLDLDEICNLIEVKAINNNVSKCNGLTSVDNSELLSLSLEKQLFVNPIREIGFKIKSNRDVFFASKILKSDQQYIQSSFECKYTNLKLPRNLNSNSLNNKLDTNCIKDIGTLVFKNIGTVDINLIGYIDEANEKVTSVFNLACLENCQSNNNVNDKILSILSHSENKFLNKFYQLSMKINHEKADYIIKNYVLKVSIDKIQLIPRLKCVREYSDFTVVVPTYKYKINHNNEIEFDKRPTLEYIHNKTVNFLDSNIIMNGFYTSSGIVDYRLNFDGDNFIPANGKSKVLYNSCL